MSEFIIAPASLKMWLPMSEGTGTTTADKSGNSNSGTFQGTPNPSWSTGISGKAVTMSGTNGCRVEVADSASLSGINSLTIAVIAKFTNPAVASSGIVVKNLGTQTEWELAVVSSAGKLYFVVYSGTGGTIYRQRTGATTVSSLENGKFHHIVATYGGTAASQNIYINGVLDDGASATGGTWSAVANTTAPVYVGMNSIVGRIFNGSVDDVKIWNTALSAQQIAILYNSFKGAYLL